MFCDQGTGFCNSALFCELCGYPCHFSCHKNCPMAEPTEQTNPSLKIGWQCSRCRVCRKCKTAGEPDKLAACEVCDKVYHTHCTTPVLSSAPKCGWKCENCRKCDDCGSKTPGSGLSSRWHCNYSLCDSCYQQRNKGCACPVCGKAYRIINQKFMRECTLCKKFVHGECDSLVASSTVYICQLCRNPQADLASVKLEPNFSGHAQHQNPIVGLYQQQEMGGASSSNFSLSSDTNRSSSIYSADENDEDILNDILKSEAVQSPMSDLDISCIDTADNFNLDTWTAAVEEEFGGASDAFLLPAAPHVQRYPGGGHSHQQEHASACQMLANSRRRPTNSKRSTKGKGTAARSSTSGRRGRNNIRSFSRISATAHDSTNTAPSADGSGDVDWPTASMTSNKASPDGDEYTRTTVVDTVDQQYMFTRDICVVCGSLGKGVEADLIPCYECGQCYHLYCADVKLNQVVVQRGWRCLNCTICEGCGRADDEQHLLLCDECDFSIHTHCLDPPLSGIPTGSWTCQWCSRCALCEAPLTGSSQKIPSFKENMLKLCIKCESSYCCPLCRVNYRDKDILIKCERCEKWSHGKCNGLLGEEAVENAAAKNFKCAVCRPGYIHTLDDNSPEKLPEILHSVDGVLLTKIGAGTLRWRPGAQSSSGRRPIGTTNVGPGAQQAIDDVVDSVAALFSDRKIAHDLEMGRKDFAELVDEESFKRAGLKWAKRFKVGLGGFSVKQVRNRFGQHTSGFGDRFSVDRAATQGFDLGLKRKKRQRRKGELDDAYPSYIQANKPTATNCNQPMEGSQDLSMAGENAMWRETGVLFGEDPSLQSSSDFSNILDMLMNEDIDDVLASSSFGSHSKSLENSCAVGSMEPMTQAPVMQIQPTPMQGMRPTLVAPNFISTQSMGGPQAFVQQATFVDRTQSTAFHLAQQRFSAPPAVPQSQQYSGAPTDHFVVPPAPPSYSIAVQSLQQTPPTFCAVQRPAFNLLASGHAVRPASVCSNFDSPVASRLASNQTPIGNAPPPSTPLIFDSSCIFDSSTAGQATLEPTFDSSSLPLQTTPTVTQGGNGNCLDSKSTLDRWESDEPLGDRATTAAVLYANSHHPQLRHKFPHWPERAKQIGKLWRLLAPDQRQRFVLLARENRTLSRQQTVKTTVKNSEDTQLSPATPHISPSFCPPSDLLFKVPTTPYSCSEFSNQNTQQVQPKFHIATFGAPEMPFRSVSTGNFTQVQKHPSLPLQPEVKIEATESHLTSTPCNPQFTVQSNCQFGQSAANSNVPSAVNFSGGQSGALLNTPVYSNQSAMTSENVSTTPFSCNQSSQLQPPTSDPSTFQEADQFGILPLQQNRDLQYEGQLLEAQSRLTSEQKTLESRLAELRRYKKALVFKRKQQMIKAGLIVEGVPIVGPLTGLESDGRLEELTRDIGEIQKVLEPLKRRAKQHSTLLRDYRHRCGATTPPPKPSNCGDSKFSATSQSSLHEEGKIVAPHGGVFSGNLPKNLESKFREKLGNETTKRKWSRRKQSSQSMSFEDIITHEVALTLTETISSVIKLVDGDNDEASLSGDYHAHSLLKTLLRSSPITGEFTQKESQPILKPAAGVKRQMSLGGVSTGSHQSTEFSRSAVATNRKRSRKITAPSMSCTMPPSSEASGTTSAAALGSNSSEVYAEFLQRLAVKLAGTVDSHSRRATTSTAQLREPPPRCDAFSVKLGVTALADKIVETIEKTGGGVAHLKLKFAPDTYALVVFNNANFSDSNEAVAPAVVNSRPNARSRTDRDSLIGRVESPSDFVYGSVMDYEEDLQSSSYPALKTNFGGAGPFDGRLSPNFRLTAHVPVRAQPPDPPHSALEQMTRSRLGFVRTGANDETISVTLTLSPDASRDIGRVLSGLAALLGMDVPNIDYELRLDTPPSSPINKASLEEQRKLVCCACKVYVEQAAIRKKFSEIGLISVGGEEEAVFCSLSCFDRFIARITPHMTNMTETANFGPHLPIGQNQTAHPPPSVKKLSTEKANVRLDEIIRCVAGGSNQPAPSAQPTPLQPALFATPSASAVSKLATPPSARCGQPLAFDQSAAQLKSGYSTLTDPSHVSKVEVSNVKMYGDGLACEHLLSVRDLAMTCRASSEESAKEKSHKISIEFKLKGTKWLMWSSADKSLTMGYFCTVEKLRISLKASLYRCSDEITDQRTCQMCSMVGDDAPERCGRLLNVDAGQWVHVNCALWSAEVYETMEGGLVNVDRAVQRSHSNVCCMCDRCGATLPCYKLHCTHVYHFACALQRRCAFLKDKTVFCPEHLPPGPDNVLTDLSVLRRIFIERDENRLLARLCQQGNDGRLALRIGSLIFQNIGQLLPHQLKEFSTEKFIFPVGYSVSRIFWSKHMARQRILYKCSILDKDDRPSFEINIEKPSIAELIHGRTASETWADTLKSVESLRGHGSKTLKFFTSFLFGEYLYGLTEPSVQKMIESLPGVESLVGYEFKFGRNPLMDLPLAVNPSGCARCEPRCRTYVKNKSHSVNLPAQHLSWPALLAMSGLGSESQALWNALGGRPASISKWSQYRKMKQEWKTNVYLARSKIQGLGLYAKRNIEMNAIVIEYIGQVIRNEVAERREKMYEAHSRGVYMFRMDHERVIDATMSGGPARYINHSCDPNCVTDSVQLNNGDIKIVIAACRPISDGEELTYDYQFDFEDDARKIPCLCAAPNCRKWMN